MTTFSLEAIMMQRQSQALAWYDSMEIDSETIVYKFVPSKALAWLQRKQLVVEAVLAVQNVKFMAKGSDRGLFACSEDFSGGTTAPQSVGALFIAIIGSGLAALSTAIRLEQAGFNRITIYERDASLISRREGYGLTLKYDPKGVLQQLGVLEKIALADCPSRSHYLLTETGQVRGYYGNAFKSKHGGFGQRGNLRVPRQVVREILVKALRVTRIAWNHKLIKVEAIKVDTDKGETNGTKMRLIFEHEAKPVDADWIIAADGIRSATVDCILPHAPQPKPMGVRLILGLTRECSDSKLDLNHPLLRERGFYTLTNGHRLFVMPYSASSPLHPDEHTRYMWQLSFLEDINEASAPPKLPEQLIKEALDRCRDWHNPVLPLIQSTPLNDVWSTHLCDRDPTQIHDLQLKKIAKQQGSASNQSFFDRVVVIGDALHAMSCFKGQGANQALLDGIVVAKWFSSAASGACTSPLALLRGCMREVVQRTSPIVAASRTAAHYWHSDMVLRDEHTFAGVPNDRVEELLGKLHNKQVSANATPNLDVTIQEILEEMNVVQAIESSDVLTVDKAWKDAVMRAIRGERLDLLRELSWLMSNSLALQSLRFDDNDDSCLHLATRMANMEMIYWLATQAGCDAFTRNADNQTAYDVSMDRDVSDLLARIIMYQGKPLDLEFHPSRSLLVAALVDGTLEVHDFAELIDNDDDEPDSLISSTHVHTQLLASKTTESGSKQAAARCVQFSSSGEYIYSGGTAGDLVCLNADRLSTFTTSQSAKTATQWSIPKASYQASPLQIITEMPNPNLIVTGDEAGGVRIWDVRMCCNTSTSAKSYATIPGCVHSWKKHDDYVSGLECSSDGNTLLACSADCTLSVYDVRSESVLSDADRFLRRSDDQEDELLSIKIMKNGRKVVCGTGEGVLCMWSYGVWGDVSDRLPGHPQSIDALLKVDESTLLTGSSDGLIRVVSIHPNKFLGVLGECPFPIEKLCLSACGNYVGSVTHDNVVRCYDARILRDDCAEDENNEDGVTNVRDNDEQMETVPILQATSGTARQGSDDEWSEMDEASAAADEEMKDSSDSDSDSDSEDGGGQNARPSRLKTDNEKFFEDL
ncbi:hypothetical protein MPSEU_000914700 [Mayamaea pseudoterrestris]|nr:hypothetical protein MPSEU_000914700 [Mayamaea pseudoterrestris]